MTPVAYLVPDPSPGVVIQSFDATAFPPRSWEVLVERWAACRERWSQLTFYLSSGDAWR
jgi:hypothetical protein